MKSKIPEPVIVSPPSMAETDTAAKEAATREAELIRKKKGAASTIMTGPSGVLTPPTVLKEKLGE